MNDKNCPSEEMLVNFADNELNEQEAVLVNEHICDCEDCSKLVAEHRELARLLAEDRISQPSQAEWRYLMVRVRAKLRGGTRVWDRPGAAGRPGRRPQILPAWTRTAAIVCAGIVALVILWRTGVIDLGRESHRTVITGRIAQKTPGGEEKNVPGALSAQGKVNLSEAAFASLDSTSINLAGLSNDELYELGELSTCARTSRDYDALLVDLSKEDQAAIIKQLETSFSM